MQKYSEMSREQLLDLKKELDKQYADIKAQGLALDMSRGKPAAEVVRKKHADQILYENPRKMLEGKSI